MGIVYRLYYLLARSFQSLEAAYKSKREVAIHQRSENKICKDKVLPRRAFMLIGSIRTHTIPQQLSAKMIVVESRRTLVMYAS